MSTEAALHPLAELKARLVEIVHSEDLAGFSQLLRGLNLPILGGNEPPAELIWRSLSYPPEDPGIGLKLAQLTAVLLREFPKAISSRALHSEVAEPSSLRGISSQLAGADEEIPEQLELYLSSLLLFSSFLPTEPGLFAALKRFIQPTELGFDLPIEDTSGRLLRRLRGALIVQQTDSSLVPLWLALLDLPLASRGALETRDQALLMDGWSGLLWAPPETMESGTSSGAPAKRLAIGLEKLAASVKGSADAVSLLRWAVRSLDRAFPRDPSYWQDRLTGSLELEEGSPLRQALLEHWPELELGPSHTVAESDHPASDRLDEDSALDLYAQALKLVHDGQLELAVEILSNLVSAADHKITSRARQLLEMCESRLEGVEHDPTEDPYLLAVAFKREQRYPEALAVCKTHLDDERFVYLKASVHALEKNPDEALESLVRVAEMNPQCRVVAYHDPDFRAIRNHPELESFFKSC